MKKAISLVALLVAVAALAWFLKCQGCLAESQDPQEALPVGEAADAPDADATYAAALLAPGTPAPDFTLATPDGAMVSLADLRGQYVVIDFWASWCPDCRKDLPAVKSLYERHASQGVAFVGVSFDTEKEKWTRCIEENGLAWTQVSPLQKWKTKHEDGTQEVLIPVAEDYRVEWIPTMYLIDPEGRVALATVMVEKMARALASLQ